MPAEPCAPWLRELKRYFGNSAGVGVFTPPADLLATDEDVTVHMDVPGVTSENLEIELENDVVTVRGDRPYSLRDGSRQRAWQRIERGFGRFERDLRVPKGPEPGSIDASLTDGVLTRAGTTTGSSRERKPADTQARASLAAAD